jgi:hypothetical protein
LAAVGSVGVDGPRLVVVRARVLGDVLGFDSASLCGGMTLAGLGGTFVGFRLGTLCLGCLLVGGGSRAFGLDGATSCLLSKLSGLLATMIVAPAAGGTNGDEE